MSSIATSALKNMGFSQASRSIASNAENAVRMTTAKENFGNTATSARGKKRTHGLVFESNHRNDKQRYIRYYRSHQYASKHNAQNPMTRESNNVKLARYSNTSRKALFDRAVAAKNATEVIRLLNERYVLTPQRAVDAIRAFACHPRGLEAVQRILTATAKVIRDVYNIDNVYRSIFQCSKARAQDLINVFLKFDLVPVPYYEPVLPDIIDWGLDNGVDVAVLKKLFTKALSGLPYTPQQSASSILALIFLLQLKRHSTERMPPRLKQLFDSLRGGFQRSSLINAIFAVAPRPARIIRWLVEDTGYRITANDVTTALHYRHMQVAVYMASKHTWSNAEKQTLAEFLNNSEQSESFRKNVRAPAFSRILREVVGLPAPPRAAPRTNTKQNAYRLLDNGNIILYGPQTSYPPQHVRVHKPQTNGNRTIAHRGVFLLQTPNSRLPPERIASQANLNAWERRHGIIRGATRQRTNKWGTKMPMDWSSNDKLRSIVPPPQNARNRNNYRYVRANTAARKIQTAYRRSKK